MAAGDYYRAKAAEFAAMAMAESDKTLQAERGQMAAAYMRLAELADRNALNDVAFETPKRRG